VCCGCGGGGGGGPDGGGGGGGGGGGLGNPPGLTMNVGPGTRDGL